MICTGTSIAQVLVQEDIKMKPKMYLIRFIPDTGGFFKGWNYVYATNLAEATKKLREKLGNCFDQIDWSSLKTGKKAEDIERELEKQYGSCFD